MALENLEKDGKINEKNEVLLYEGDGLMRTEKLTICKNAVCLIRCETKCSETGKRLRKQGTGFYVKASVFGVDYCCVVTNNHVICCEDDARNGFAIFNYEKENQGGAVKLRPEKVFRTNKKLDYSVIGVNEDELNRLIPPVFPIEYKEQPPASVGDDIVIFQHPMGEPKQHSSEKIIHIDYPFVYYIADTKEGSSGSPVFWKLQLMAIHQVGNEKDKYNKGILFSEIINDLHAGINRNGGTTKRNNDYLARNCPREMEENSCKRICVGSCQEEEKSVDFCVKEDLLDEESSLPPDDKILDHLSQECCAFYKRLGRRLGVKNDKIEEISRDQVNYGSLPDKCFQVLQGWKEANASQCTNQALENALRSLDKNALANKYFR